MAAGIFGNRAAKREAARRNAEARKLQDKLNRLEMNRQAIINPYEDVTNLSGMLSSFCGLKCCYWSCRNAG